MIKKICSFVNQSGDYCFQEAKGDCVQKPEIEVNVY